MSLTMMIIPLILCQKPPGLLISLVTFNSTGLRTRTRFPVSLSSIDPGAWFRLCFSTHQWLYYHRGPVAVQHRSERPLMWSKETCIETSDRQCRSRSQTMNVIRLGNGTLLPESQLACRRSFVLPHREQQRGLGLSARETTLTAVKGLCVSASCHLRGSGWHRDRQIA